MSHAVSTMRPVCSPYKEWRGFSVCFERFTSAFPRERLHADVSVGQMFHFFHSQLQRNSGNCQDWLLADTQLPYGDPECILESLTQIAAPASAVPEAVNSLTASSGADFQGLCSSGGQALGFFLLSPPLGSFGISVQERLFPLRSPFPVVG